MVAIALMAACPSCAVGQGRGASDDLALVLALILLPLAAAGVAGFLIGRMLRRHSRE